MKIKKNIFMIIVLFLFLMVSLVNAKIFFGVDFEDTLFVEDFDYATTYTANDWLFQDLTTCGNTPTTPQQSPYTETDDLGFGGTYTCGGGGGDVQLTKHNNFSSVTSGRQIWIINYSIGFNHTGYDSQSIINLRCDINQNAFTINDNQNHTWLSIDNKRIGGEDCLTELKDVFHHNETFEILFDFNYDDNTYSVYVNRTLTDCAFKTFGTDDGTKCLNGYLLAYQINTSSQMNSHINYLGVWNKEFVNLTILAEVSEPCNTNADCTTGNCEYHFCRLALGGFLCDSDMDCVSGDCVSGTCTNPSLWQGIEATKTQQFGNDSNSNNFVALFFIVGIPLIFVWVGQSMASGFVAVGSFFFLSIFFAIVGWLSPFILIGNILMALIVVVFMFVMGGRSG